MCVQNNVDEKRRTKLVALMKSKHINKTTPSEHWQMCDLKHCFVSM